MTENLFAAPDEAAGRSMLEIVIEFEGLTEEVVDDLRRLFIEEGEDVVFSHAFGGADTVAIIAKFGRSAFDRLIVYFGSARTIPSKTKVRIGKSSIEMTGFSREDIEALLASRQFASLTKVAFSTGR